MLRHPAVTVLEMIPRPAIEELGKERATSPVNVLTHGVSLWQKMWTNKSASPDLASLLGLSQVLIFLRRNS